MRVLTAYLLAYGVLNALSVKEDGDFRAAALNRLALFTFGVVDAIVEIGRFRVDGTFALLDGGESGDLLGRHVFMLVEYIYTPYTT